MRNFCLILALMVCFEVEAQQENILSQHPRLYVRDGDKGSIWQKIDSEQWAGRVYANLRNRITPYADRHQTDPQWLLSRMAMYWRDGEHYTQCYLKNENWDRGEGNAPVPTVRMPGMRIWNQYSNVPLAERTPYNETGDMWGYEIGDNKHKILVPYKESGHMIRGNNVEILTLAEQSAFLYWLTSEEKYGKLAADVFNQWLVGTYYMQPILDPGRSSGGFGGYEPGGILGYYDYEQIHDDLALHGALVYDMAYDYINSHPHSHLSEIGKTTQEVADTVFKRFINIGMVRGGKRGNWNVNGWNMILMPILMLGDNSQYADGKGCSYYLNYFLNESTPHHDALPDILKGYDSETGLWPESPGYAFSTINMLSDFACLLKNQGIDIIQSSSVFQKAAVAFLPWMDSRANMIVFGDSRGGTADFSSVENLYSYYVQTGNQANSDMMAAVLQKGIEMGSYNRRHANWKALCRYEPLPKKGNVSLPIIRKFWSPFHRVLTMRSQDDQLMAVLYGGRNGSHLSHNGLALQLYGFGYALAPESSGYVSYWSDDYRYHQQATGSNTIIPGYTHGEVTLNTVTNDSLVNFADMSAGEKRRCVAIVSTGEGKGYYLDVFRSDTDDSDYLMHVTGKRLSLSRNNGKELSLAQCDSFERKLTKGYDFFSDIQTVRFGADYMACWQIDDHRRMQMWMAGAENRELITCRAPHSTITAGITPNDIGYVPNTVPTLIVRQQSNAWKRPFVAVYEPVDSTPVVKSVKYVTIDSRKVEVVVSLCDGHKDRICITTEGEMSFTRK